MRLAQPRMAQSPLARSRERHLKRRGHRWNGRSLNQRRTLEWSPLDRSSPRNSWGYAPTRRNHGLGNQVRTLPSAVCNFLYPSFAREASKIELLGRLCLIVVRQPQDFIDDHLRYVIGAGLLSEFHIDLNRRICPSSRGHRHMRPISHNSLGKQVGVSVRLHGRTVGFPARLKWHLHIKQHKLRKVVLKPLVDLGRVSRLVMTARIACSSSSQR